MALQACTAGGKHLLLGGGGVYWLMSLRFASKVVLNSFATLPPLGGPSCCELAGRGLRCILGRALLRRCVHCRDIYLGCCDLVVWIL